MQPRIRVGVIFGGRSGEHEVSLRSARSVIEAVDKQKYEVVPIGISKEGHWLTGGDPLKTLAAQVDPRLLKAPDQATDQTGTSVALAQTSYLLPSAAPLRELDVIFPVLHGPYGEDGTIQGLLELAGLPYVGAGLAGSVLGMDKVLFKDVIQSHGLPVGSFVSFTRKRWEREPDAVVADIEKVLGYPVFTKPANMGSSVGISKCDDRQALKQGLAEAAQFDRKLLIEAAIPNAREIECSVLGNDDPIASLPGEIVPSREFYDYTSKYIDEGDEASDLLIPAPLLPEMSERVQALAIKTYLAIDCAGMARVDFLLNDETQELFVNEVNTIPGFTSISMYPKLWEATGIPYTELISRLIDLAIERFEDRQRCQTDCKLERNCNLDQTNL